MSPFSTSSMSMCDGMEFNNTEQGVDDHDEKIDYDI